MARAVAFLLLIVTSAAFAFEYGRIKGRMQARVDHLAWMSRVEAHFRSQPGQAPESAPTRGAGPRAARHALAAVPMELPEPPASAP